MKTESNNHIIISYLLFRNFESSISRCSSEMKMRLKKLNKKTERINLNERNFYLMWFFSTENIRYNIMRCFITNYFLDLRIVKKLMNKIED